MNQKAKTKYRASPKWKETRQIILKQYDYTCYICKIEKRASQSRFLQVHHIVPSSYGNEDIEELVLLCSSCHKHLLERILRRKDFDMEGFLTRLEEIYDRTKKGAKLAPVIT